MTYNEFWYEFGVAIGNNECKSQRLGQFLFNFLNEYKPDLADTIRGTDDDPFYEDSKIAAFALYLQENWK